MDFSVYIIIIGLMFFAFFLPFKMGLLKEGKFIFICTLIIGLAFCLRCLGLDYKTGDYNGFLSQWVEYYRVNGGFKALANSLGNYNIPYLYFLSAFSYIGISDLYLIKLLSIFFDIILAFSMAKLVSVYTDNKTKILWAYLLTLVLPTVIINSSVWAQCDSIYVSLGILSLYFILTNKPKTSMVFMALSFSFKLQAIFLMPVFAVMWFAKKIRFHEFFVFPLTYLAVIMPAVLLGRPLIDAVTIYINQANTVGTAMNYNSPSMFSFYKGGGNEELLGNFAIILAFLFVALVLLFAFKNRKNLDNITLLYVTLIMVIGVPFILPHMHDRYFFFSDVLTLSIAIIMPRYFILPILASFASLICYYGYFYRVYLILPSYGAFSLLVVLAVLLMNYGNKLSISGGKIYRNCL